MTGAFPEDIRLIRWIEDNLRRARYNLSMSGLPEPDFKAMGVDTSLESMKSQAPDPARYFTEVLSELYGYDKKEIFLTTGGSEAIFLLSLLAKSMDSAVFTGIPEYEPIFNVPRNMGCNVRMSHFSTLPDEVSRYDGRRSVFLSNPNNPMGNSYSGGYIETLKESVSRDGFLYVDEAFIEFRLETRPKSVYDGSPNLVVNGSLTKFYGFSGMRVGWIVTDSEKLRTLNVIRTITGTRNPDYPLWIAAQCLLNRNKFQERAKSIIEPNLRSLSRVIDKSGKISWEVPRDAPYALLRYDGGMDSQKLCNIALDRYGLFLDPGDYFGQPNSFRVCFTSKPSEFAESMDVFRKFIDEVL